MGGRKRKYATPEEAKAAAKAQQAAYRAARKAGTWVRKNRILSERIAAKAGVEVGFDPKVGGVTEEAKAEAEKAAAHCSRIRRRTGTRLCCPTSGRMRAR